MCERRRESTYLRDRPRRHLEVSIHGGATFRSYSPSGGPASLHETRPSPPVSTSQSHRSDTHRQDKTVGVTGTYATPGRHELSSSIAQAPVPMQAPDGASTKRPASDTGHTTFAASSWDCASAASAAAVSAIPSRPDDVDVQWHAIRPPRASAVVWRPLRAFMGWTRLDRAAPRVCPTRRNRAPRHRLHDNRPVLERAHPRTMMCGGLRRGSHGAPKSRHWQWL